MPILIEKNFEQIIYLSLENEVYFFFKKGNSIFPIKLGQRLLKSFSQLYVKNSTFFRSYFFKKDYKTKKDYKGPKAADSPLSRFFIVERNE